MNCEPEIKYQVWVQHQIPIKDSLYFWRLAVSTARTAVQTDSWAEVLQFDLTWTWGDCSSGTLHSLWSKHWSISFPPLPQSCFFHKPSQQCLVPKLGVWSQGGGFDTGRPRRATSLHKNGPTHRKKREDHDGTATKIWGPHHDKEMNQVLHMYFLYHFSNSPWVVPLNHFGGSGASIEFQVLFGTLQVSQIRES